MAFFTKPSPLVRNPGNTQRNKMIKRIIGPLYTLWKSICYDFSLEEESSCDKTMTNSFYELLGMGLLVEILGGVATFANNDNFVNNHFMRL